MSRVIETDLNRALAKALTEEPQFRNWFLDRTEFAGHECDCVLTRADNAWTTADFIVTNSETGATERISRQGETDVLAVFKAHAGGHCFALHIENKLAHSRFTKYQPEGYLARAEKWVGNLNYGNYQRWQTVLVAPKAFYSKQIAQVEKFGTFICHEEIARFIPAFDYRRTDA